MNLPRVAFIYLVGVVLFMACKFSVDKEEITKYSVAVQSVEAGDSIELTEEALLISSNTIDYDTLQWNEIKNEDGFLIDMRYATKNNFTKEIIYNCGRCFLRPELARKLAAINQQILRENNWHFKLFDCYRPRPAQEKLWEIVPNPIYVTPPQKGSMHNRGLAVDLTFVDTNGVELDMGTAFDYFGPLAHHNNKDHSKEIIERRIYLKNLMESHGFNAITSEWWHYSLNGTGHGFSDWEWECGDVN